MSDFGEDYKDWVRQQKCAVCVSDIPDLDETLSEWANWDNSFIERHDLETAKNLPFCDVAWTDGKKSHA